MDSSWDAPYQWPVMVSQDWADPNSRDIAGDGLHAVHVALHGGRMDFSAERAEVLRRLLEP